MSLKLIDAGQLALVAERMTIFCMESTRQAEDGSLVRSISNGETTTRGVQHWWMWCAHDDIISLISAQPISLSIIGAVQSLYLPTMH
jgi:hypothetical protein